MSTSRRPVIIVDDVIEDRSHRAAQSTSGSSPPHVKRYTRGRYLGKGGFAKVYAFTSLDSGREYACKIIPKASLVKDSSRKKLMNEINIHRTIRHPQVVRFERFFEDKNNIYILLELCHNQTMLELVKKRGSLTEVECQFYIMQLLLTIQHLHSSAIIHRDLKLGNLFLGEGLDLKVGDFGLATRLDHVDERKRTICGTPNYIAPEILDNTNGHSFEVDVWAIGVIMYTLLYGAPPFETASVKTTYTRIRDNIYSFPSPSDPNYRSVTPAAKALIRRILCTDPKGRPTLTEMRNDSFFSQSAIPERMGLSVLEKEFPRQHECWRIIKEEEMRDREDERRRKEEGQDKDNDQENTIKDTDAAENAPPTKGDAIAAVQAPFSAPRVVLGEKPVNALKEVMSVDVAPVAVERKAVMAKVVASSSSTSPVVRPSSPQPKLPKRKETLEKEREEIITRLKARTAASPPSTSVLTPSTTPLSAASSNAGGPHPFLHPVNGGGKAKEMTSSVVPSPSSFRRTLTGVPPSSLTLSPSIRRTLSAVPVLSTVTGPIVPSPPSTTTTVTTVTTVSSTSSVIRSVPALRPSPSLSTPARSKSVSPVPSPFNARTPLPGRSTPSSLPSAPTSSSSTPTYPPCPSPPNSDSPLTWSTSPSQLVSIASAEPPSTAPPSSSALPSPCESPPPLGEVREVDELRRGREERELRAELEEKIEEERKRIREEGGNEKSGRVTRGAAVKRKEKEEEKEMDTLTTAVQTMALTRRGHHSPPPPLLPPLPSVIEESFIAAGAGEDGSFTPSLYVDKWVDYSAKYGLGYLLSDGRVGVYFNDASKAIMHGPSLTTTSSSTSTFTYVERRSREEGGGEQIDQYDLHDHPPALHKKVTLLKHFSNYLTNRSSSAPSPSSPSFTPSSSSCSSLPSLPYVRKWLRTKHAIFFRLSCGSVQVIFNDRTELVVGEGRVVYTDRGGRRVGGPLDEIEGKKEEGLAKRLRYMREILQHMNNKTQRGGAQEKGDDKVGKGDEERKGRGRSKRT